MTGFETCGCNTYPGSSDLLHPYPTLLPAFGSPGSGTYLSETTYSDLRAHSHTLITDFIMPEIASIEYFRVPPRWLFVKITDKDGNVGWGEASLEGHTQAVEGCLDAYIARYTGMEAEYVDLRCRISTSNNYL